MISLWLSFFWKLARLTQIQSVTVEKGHKVSKTKLQLWKIFVPYLGHGIFQGRLSFSHWFHVKFLLPTSVAEVYTERMGYCCQWILNLAELTNSSENFCYSLLLPKSPKSSFLALTFVFVSIFAVEIPDCSKPFVFFGHELYTFAQSINTEAQGTKQTTGLLQQNVLGLIAFAFPPWLGTKAAAL